jgi:hypothetical protein
MKSHRKISLTTALVAALVAVLPVSASANSLLSGYGGPGAGNQAILGSTLIGAGGSAGGGSASSSGSAGSSEPTGSSGSAGSEAASGGEAASDSAGGQGPEGDVKGGAAGEGGGAKATGAAGGSRGRHGKTSAGAARAYPVRPLDDASKPSSAGSGALSLSAADFGYLLLVLAALGATGVVTSRLARAPVGAGRPAAIGKGHGG